jgi:hypothetical protein
MAPSYYAIHTHNPQHTLADVHPSIIMTKEKRLLDEKSVKYKGKRRLS